MLPSARPDGPATLSYVAYGRTLLSEIPLPELEPSSDPPDILITFSAPPLALDLGSPRRLLDEQGEVWLVVDDRGTSPILSFPGVGSFAVDLGGRRITCHLDERADPRGLRHALLDHVVPRLLVATGGTVLHASGVVVGGRAVLFAGRSGAGKSTLAARCAALGLAVLADDAAVLQPAGHGWEVQPSYPGLRLWPDSIDLLGVPVRATPLGGGSAKSRVGGQRAASTSHELSAIVAIERRPGPIEGRRLTGTDAFSALWGTVFAWPGKVLDEDLLDRVSTLAAEAVVLRLGYSDAAEPDEVLAAVVEAATRR